MTKKRKIPYAKIMSGLKCCLCDPYDRMCTDCPYEKLNADDDPFGDAPAFCLEGLKKDVKRLTDELEYFCHCEDCALWSKFDADNNFHDDWKDERRCSNWEQMTAGHEFCSRGCRKDD